MLHKSRIDRQSSIHVNGEEDSPTEEDAPGEEDAPEGKERNDHGLDDVWELTHRLNCTIPSVVSCPEHSKSPNSLLHQSTWSR